ncbi:hypothetical protein AB0H69_34625 [Streptomyces phaeochromogenes]|uniref:hypothetical protein n=1 Tax=Streptomyces phaeochromogenes TaxID=1923 RepID=UPI0033EFE8DA
MPFNRRIDVLLAVVDTPQEVELTTQLLDARGWAVREWEGSDPTAVGPGRRGLLVEARLHGARPGAVRAAVSEIERIARRHQTGMWVVDAALIEHELDCDQWTRYRVSEQHDGTATRRFRPRALYRALATLRIVNRPGRKDPVTVAELLETGALTGHPFHRRKHNLELLSGRQNNDDGSARPPDAATSTWRIAVPVLLSLFLALATGSASVALDGSYRWLSIIAAILLTWPTGRLIVDNGSHRPLWMQLSWGVLVVGPVAASGAMLALAVPGPAPEVALVTICVVAGLAVFIFILQGLSHALVHSWLSRNANWAVPAMVPALALVLPWFGGLLHTLYLQTGFDIPADGASVSLYWRYMASLLPLGVAVALALAWVSVAGWLRHHYQWIPSRGTSTAVVYALCVVILGMFALAGMSGAQRASGDAWSAVRAGKKPSPYYGLQGSLVCVKPLARQISVFNGPLDSERPLLTFGPSGDRVWLWDPRRTESLSVRLEDVIVTEARQGDCG